MGSSNSHYLKCSDQDLLLQLAKCFTNNAPALGTSSCLVLDTPVCAHILRCLPHHFADSSNQGAEYAPVSFSGVEYARVVEVAIGKAENLELVHNDATIEGQLDLSRFHSLLRLRLKSVPMHLLFNLSERRDTLAILDVDSCTASLMSVIELCAGDRTSGANWPCLKHLRFSGCRLRHLDLSVRYLVALTHLDLSYNQLVRVDELQHLKCLQSLNLSFNRLHRLPSLATCRSLRRLRLAYNFLESLTGVEDLRRLELLDARHNVICHLALIGELRRLIRLQSLDLRGNPAETARDHRAQLLQLLHCREPTRLLLNGRRLSAEEVRALVHAMKRYPRSISAEDSIQLQRHQLARGSVNAGYSTADEFSESPAPMPAATFGQAVVLVHVNDAAVLNDSAISEDKDDYDDDDLIAGDGPSVIAGSSMAQSRLPGNFTNECEADVSSAEEPPTSPPQLQHRHSGSKRGSAALPSAGGQNMRDYLAGLRQHYGDGYIVRLNEQQQQQRQRQQLDEQQQPNVQEDRLATFANDRGQSPSPIAVSSTPLDPPGQFLAVPSAAASASVTATMADRTPQMDSIGSDVFVLPPAASRLQPPPPPPPPTPPSSTADGGAISVERELGLIRGHQYLAIQTDTSSGVMLTLADHQLTVRRPNGELSEELDLRRLVAFELPQSGTTASAADSILRLRFSGVDQPSVRTFQLQEDDPADVEQLAALLSPFASIAAAADNRMRCARCEHSFNAAEARRSILPCESAHSLSDIREAAVCPNCGSEFIAASGSSAAPAAAAPASLGPPAAKFFVGSIGTDMSAPRFSPPAPTPTPPPPPPPPPQTSSFANTPSMTSLDSRQLATAATVDTVDGGFDFEQEQERPPELPEGREELPADVAADLDTYIGSPASTAAPTETDAYVTASPTADCSADLAQLLADPPAFLDQEILPVCSLTFNPSQPKIIDHRLKLHLDLKLLGDGEEAAFAVLLAGCQLLTGKRNSDWEALRSGAVLVGTSRQLLLLNCSSSDRSGDDELSRSLAVAQKWPLAALTAVRYADFAGGLALLRLGADARLLAPLGHRAKLDALAGCLQELCSQAQTADQVASPDGETCFCVVLPDAASSAALAVLVIDSDQENDSETLRLIGLMAADVVEALTDGRRPDWRLTGRLVDSAPLTSLQSLSLLDATKTSLAGAPLKLEFFPEDGVASWSVVMATPAARRELCRCLAEPWQRRFGVELPVGSLSESG